MKPTKATAALWDRANKKTAAQHGLPGSDAADAIPPVVTIKSLIRQIGTNPDALELLAARSHEMTDTQRTAALKALQPPKKPKARTPATAPRRAMTPAPVRTVVEHVNVANKFTLMRLKSARGR